MQAGWDWVGYGPGGSPYKGPHSPKKRLVNSKSSDDDANSTMLAACPDFNESFVSIEEETSRYGREGDDELVEKGSETSSSGGSEFCEEAIVVVVSDDDYSTNREESESEYGHAFNSVQVPNKACDFTFAGAEKHCEPAVGLATKAKHVQSLVGPDEKNKKCIPSYDSEVIKSKSADNVCAAEVKMRPAVLRGQSFDCNDGVKPESEVVTRAKKSKTKKKKTEKTTKSKSGHDDKTDVESCGGKATVEDGSRPKLQRRKSFEDDDFPKAPVSDSVPRRQVMRQVSFDSDEGRVVLCRAERSEQDRKSSGASAVASNDDEIHADAKIVSKPLPSTLLCSSPKKIAWEKPEWTQSPILRAPRQNINVSPRKKFDWEKPTWAKSEDE